MSFIVQRFFFHVCVFTWLSSGLFSPACLYQVTAACLDRGRHSRYVLFPSATIISLCSASTCSPAERWRARDEMRSELFSHGGNTPAASYTFLTNLYSVLTFVIIKTKCGSYSHQVQVTSGVDMVSTCNIPPCKCESCT